MSVSLSRILRHPVIHNFAYMRTCPGAFVRELEDCNDFMMNESPGQFTINAQADNYLKIIILDLK